MSFVPAVQSQSICISFGAIPAPLHNAAIKAPVFTASGKMSFSLRAANVFCVMNTTGTKANVSVMCEGNWIGATGMG